MNLIAHRGLHNNEIKENSKEAITEAFKAGYDSVEIDIRSTKDNIIILSHGATVKNVFGIELEISAIKYEDLKLSCKGIVTFEEVIEQFRTKHLLVEIKDIKTFENLNIKLLPKAFSFQSFFLEGISALAKEIPNDCGLLFPSYNFNLGISFLFKRKVFWKKLKENNIKFLSLYSFLVNKKVIAQAEKSEIELYVWTVKEKSQLEKYKSLGVKNIITEVL